MPRKKRIKHLKDNQCRIIKLEQDALFELLYETMIDSLDGADNS